MKNEVLLEKQPQILCVAREPELWRACFEACEFEPSAAIKMVPLQNDAIQTQSWDEAPTALTVLDLSEEQAPPWDVLFDLFENPHGSAWLIVAQQEPQASIKAHLEHMGLVTMISHQTPQAEMVRQIQGLLARHRDAQHAVQRAFRDSLTLLPSAELFRDRFETAVHRVGRLGFGFGLALCDVDHFKAINQKYGYAVGDQLLRQVGKRFLDRMRKSDTAARLGSDMFALIFENVIQDGTLKRLAEKVFHVMTLPYVVPLPDGEESIEIQLDFSMGLCLFPQHLTDPDQVMGAAKAALAEAKQVQGSSVVIFEPDEA